MTKSIFGILCLLSVISVALAAMGMSFPAVHPGKYKRIVGKPNKRTKKYQFLDYPGMCYDGRTKTAYQVGMNYPEGVYSADNTTNLDKK